MYSQFKVIKKKHGKDIYTLVRSFENIDTKYVRTILDMKLLKQCKKELLIPTFINVRLSTKGYNIKLKHCIVRIIIEDKLQYRHQHRKKLRNEIKNLSIELKLSLSTVLYCVLLHKINIATKSRSIAISHSHKHKRKNLNLQHKQKKSYNSNISYTTKNVVHNFSSYELSQEEHEALSYGLEHRIPSKITRNSVNTELESFYQSLLLDISIIPEESITGIKTKLRSTCEKYCNAKIPFRYRQAIKRIAILKQEEE